MNNGRINGRIRENHGTVILKIIIFNTSNQMCVDNGHV